MLDSSGSIPVAILRGNTLDLGFFDECVEISHEFDDDVLIGKYCLSGLIIPLSNSTASTSAANANAISQNLVSIDVTQLQLLWFSTIKQYNNTSGSKIIMSSFYIIAQRYNNELTDYLNS